MYKDVVEVAPHRKKAQHVPVQKAKHKHHYQPCIIASNNGLRFDRAHGFVPCERTNLWQYCTICGKIKRTYIMPWKQDDTESKDMDGLPVFTIEDSWTQDFVDIGFRVEEG